MSKRKEKKCPECGGTIRPLAISGRLMNYRNLAGLEVPAGIAIPTCDQCGSEWMDDEVATAIDDAMEPLYRACLREMVKQAIDAITQVIGQAELERKLGMTQGYLTKLKNGHRDPSPEIALHLSLIARHPKKRLKEIDEILAPRHRRSACC